MNQLCPRSSLIQIDRQHVESRTSGRPRFHSSFRLHPSSLLFWWRRRELNPDPKANAEGLYMLSCFSFRVVGTHASVVLSPQFQSVPIDYATFARFQLSDAARRWHGLVRL